jgi:DNA-binding SARP family transcriptional activator
VQEDGKKASGENFFQVNSRLEIVQWPDEVAQRLNIPSEDALGKTCHELLQTSTTRLACRSCVARTGPCLGSGGVVGMIPCACRALSLPKPTGGAVIQLFPSDPMTIGDHHLDDLATLGYVATTLSPRALHQSLEEILEILRQTLGADGMEIFVVGSQGGEIWQLAYRGLHQEAFCDRTEFQPNKGYPGLVVSKGEPIVTRDLCADDRYLRTAVKARGIRAYVCVPLLDGDRVIGSLQAAWKSEGAPIERAHRLLTWASIPIATSVLAQRACLRDSVAPDHLRSETVTAYLSAVLDTMRSTARAQAGSLVVHKPGSTEVLHKLSTDGGPGPDCPKFGSSCPCPLLRGDGPPVVAQGRRGDWPHSCQGVETPTSCILCLPLRDQSEVRGAVLFSYGDSAPRPAARFLPALMIQARECVLQIRGRWLNRWESGRDLVADPVVETKRTAIPATPKESPVPVLEARCLGRFQLFREGRSIPIAWFRRTSAVTLLKFLILGGGKHFSRDALCDLLWPEVEPGAGVNRLHGVVHALREVLEPHRAERRWLFIKNRAGHYYFDRTSPHQVDLYRFRELAVLGAKVQAQDPTQAIRCFEEAVSLYQGDLYEDEAYSEWCWTDREHLREDYLSVLKRLAYLSTAHCDLDRGVACYRLALDVDPLREDLHQGLMESLWRLGRRREALEQFERCAAVVRAELGCEPLPRTFRCHQMILQASQAPNCISP